MMKSLSVMIVDDEQVTREFFARIFPWEKVGMRWVGEAEDGLSAIEQCRTLNPDLVLVDITMPGMDGLDLIRKINEEIPDTNCVLLTCHKDFHYVEQAFSLGVMDYIVKAATMPDELVTRLKEIGLRIGWKRKQVQLGTRQQRWLKRLLLEGQPARSQIQADLHRLHFTLDDALYSILAVRLQRLGNENETLSDVNDLQIQSHFEEALEVLTSRPGKIAWTSIHPWVYTVLVNVPASGAAKFIRDIFSDLQNEMSETARLYGGISNTHLGFEKCPAVFMEADQALESRFYLEDLDLLEWREAWRQVDSVLNSRLDILKDQIQPTQSDIMKTYEHLNDQVIDLCRQNWIDPQQTRMLVAGMIQQIVDLFNLKISRWEIALLPIQAAETATALELRNWALQVIGSFLAASGYLHLRPEIQKVINAILRNISLPYDLGWVADLAGLHPNYFSAVFKQQVGQTFSEYLSRLRMQRAAEFLQDSAWSTQQVAEMVGIPHYRTFYNTFRRIVGTNPSDFRARFSHNKS